MILKPGKGFYNGRKKATEAEAREYIKTHFEGIEPELLTAADRAYYGRVKGGKKRAANAVRVGGVFVNDAFAQAELSGIAEAKGYGSVRELLEKEPGVKAAFSEIYRSGAAFEMEYNSDEVAEKIDTFRGAHIFINGREYTKTKAIERMDAFDKAIRRKFGSDVFFIQYYAKYLHGMSELHFTIPSLERVKEFEDLEDLMDWLDEQSERTISTVGSPGIGRKERERKKKYSLDYSYTVLKNGKHKKGSITASRKSEALKAIKKAHKGAIIISAKRVPKGKKK